MLNIGLKTLPALITIALTLQSCSLSGTRSTAPSAPVNPTLVIEAFAARGFLGGSDYEQYKLVKGVLWRECGSVNTGRKTLPKAGGSAEGDQVFRKDPSLIPVERRVEDLSASQQGALAALTQSILTLDDAKSGKLPAPGSLFLLAEPGLLELTIEIDGKKKRLITSVDAIADGETTSAKAARQLMATLRGVGPTICNARTFFGIPRAEREADKLTLTSDGHEQRL